MTGAPIGLYLFHVIHQYFGINLETVWQITQGEAKTSLVAIEQIDEYKSAAAVYS